MNVRTPSFSVIKTKIISVSQFKFSYTNSSISEPYCSMVAVLSIQTMGNTSFDPGPWS